MHPVGHAQETPAQDCPAPDAAAHEHAAADEKMLLQFFKEFRHVDGGMDIYPYRAKVQGLVGASTTCHPNFHIVLGDMARWDAPGHLGLHERMQAYPFMYQYPILQAIQDVLCYLNKEDSACAQVVEDVSDLSFHVLIFENGEDQNPIVSWACVAGACHRLESDGARCSCLAACHPTQTAY